MKDWNMSIGRLATLWATVITFIVVVAIFF